MKSILTVTMNPALDKSTRARQVAPEKKLDCAAPRFDPGGGGINVARAINILGGQALAVALLGGAGGKMVKERLEEEGVEQHIFGIRGLTRTNFTVLDETSGQQYRFGMPGPSVAEEEWKALLKWIRAVDPAPHYLVASGSLPLGVPEDFYAELAAIAAARGTSFVVDTKGNPLRAAVEQGVYLIKPNARELGMLAGRDITNEAEQEAVAKQLITQGKCQVVVVSLGAAGVLLVTESLCRRIRAPSVQVVSKIGAGDSTVGGVMFALGRGQSLEDAVRFGVAAGAAAVMSPGTQLCRRKDVDQLYAKISSNGETSKEKGTGNDR